MTIRVISLRLELTLLIQDRPDPRRDRAPRDATSGHGLFSTR